MNYLSNKTGIVYYKILGVNGRIQQEDTKVILNCHTDCAEQQYQTHILQVAVVNFTIRNVKYAWKGTSRDHNIAKLSKDGTCNKITKK